LTTPSHKLALGKTRSDMTGTAGTSLRVSALLQLMRGLMREFRRGVSVDPRVRTQEVRIYNTGTKTVLISHVPLEGESGKSLESGEIAIDGVPGTGAPILLDYRNACTTTLRC
jgi:2-methylaconitate cis-trans-isomerase PrpF